MKTLKEKWASFVLIIADPWNILLFVITLVFFVALLLENIFEKNIPGPFIWLLYFMLSFSSAVLGGRCLKLWTDQTQSGILAVRGKTAIRNLQLLLRNIMELRTRVEKFQQRDLNKPKIQKAIIENNYEEIISKCASLGEETVNSIENWTDIIPEASVRTQIGELSRLQADLNEKIKDRKELMAVVKKTKSQSVEEKTSLKKEIQEKETEIAQLRSQIFSQQTKFGPVFSIDPSIGGIDDPSFQGFVQKPVSIERFLHPDKTLQIYPPDLSGLGDITGPSTQDYNEKEINKGGK